MAFRKRNDDDDNSPQAKRRKRARSRHEQAAHDQQRDAVRRKLFTSFRLWTICTDKRCKRAHACSGDTDICMGRWHAVVPPETKALLQKVVSYMADGYSMEDAVAAAQRDIAAHCASLARLDRRDPPAPPPARNAPSAPPRAPGPRIRSLW